MDNKNEPAFPTEIAILDKVGVMSVHKSGNIWQSMGLTKREYFAGLAMQGMIAALTKFRTDPGMEEIIVNRPQAIAELSCLYADVLLEELAAP